MYVCGITAYDLCHIGHGRTFVVFDIVTRYLRYCGYEVNYIRNITDIDDKIIKRSAKNGETIKQLTDKMIAEMYIDLDKLNILRPNVEPKATQYITDIIHLISYLINNKYAYVSTNGDVMFAVHSAHNYGMLSRQNIDKLKIGSKFKTNDVKLNKIDFVLWKISKYGEPSWSSPWGNGRPGWHIECSTMSYKNLGKYFDIHGGGLDLIFPHHENEIAQSTCAYNSPYVNYWMHSGLVMIGKEKMSKSLNNFLTLRDVINCYDAETVRFFLMSSHYRKPLHYSEKNLIQSRAALESLYIAIRGTDNNIQPSGGEKFIQQFTVAMNNDFNTPEAYSVLFNIAHEVNRLKKHFDKAAAQGMAATLRNLANILGILELDPEIFFHEKNFYNLDNDKAIIEKLIQQRNQGRKIGQWDKADQARKKLNAMGIILEDTKNGTTIWRRYR
ncbi:Cysteinyl-tRNA synthetase [Candidatus Palibaumannia cicadellinicola]|uniref:Cysteine--tRNA ligase n=1 Tax=Candidatus Palibaumannia cicadellinicola TaxID=186490 RepID=A0A0K2BK59_9GAMM|nr:Cysteinyl-tRNA synthetase [Candidatus Baumannia cicadellinicola]